MEDRETAKNVECRYRVTATIKADRTYELEVIKARLVGLGQISFASTPSPSSPKSLQTHQNITARRCKFARLDHAAANMRQTLHGQIALARQSDTRLR
jgi:hypothetical protein